jgi:hypothetical protein
MRFATFVIAGLTTLGLSGCGATLPKLPTTGSLLGGNANTKANRDPNDPVARAMGVAATSARAQKCGYNFDAQKLKARYLAYEATSNPAASEKLSGVYDTAFAGVKKAIASQEEEYCTPDRTERLKTALNRNLAGDYTPPPSEAPADDGSLFGGWGNSSAGNDNAEGGAKMKELMSN